MFARKKLSFFLPQDTKFTLKEETENSLLFHNQHPNLKIVALKIAHSLYCYQIGLCFKNKEILTQFKQSFLPTITESSRGQHNLILNALYLHQHLDANSMETCCLGIYDANQQFTRVEALAELLFHIHAFESMNISMIKKIDEKFFNYFKDLQLEKMIKNQLTTAYFNKGTLKGFFQHIGLLVNIDIFVDKNFLTEEDGKNLALVATDIALTGTKMHNEEAERIALRR